jgi:glycosyltransferase involved in cell wall biosynthesis
MDHLDTDSLVSVVIPTRNRAKLLSRAVQSVLAQTHSHLELIVVDDNSSDDTPRFMQGIEDKRVQYIRHEATRGPGPARNAGVAASQGQFVAFLDDDDEFLPDKLQVQMDAFSKSVPSVGVVLGEVQVVRNGTPIDLFPYDGESGSIFLHVLAGNMFPLNASLIRRHVLAAFDDKLPCLEDFDFHLRVLQQTKAVYVDKPCAVYHVDNGRKRLLDDRIKIHRAFHILRGRWFNDPEDIFLKQAHADLLLNFALRLLALGLTDEVTRGYLDQAFKMKKDRRRGWYKLLNLAGPLALKHFASKGG